MVALDILEKEDMVSSQLQEVVDLVKLQEEVDQATEHQVVVDQVS